jgi:transcriptional regulator with XRE-family HTH domain
VSQEKAAKALQLSKASIGHFEHGRVDLTSDRIKTFLALYDDSEAEFQEFIEGKPIPVLDLKYECLMLLEKIDETKLRTVHAVLLGFVS